MEKKLFLICLLSFLIIIASCEDYVTSVDPPIDQIADKQLDSESQIDFLVKGVQASFAVAYCRVGFIADLLSDEMFFDINLPHATFPAYAAIDEGVISLDNWSIELPFERLGEFRFVADDLVRRTGFIVFTDENKKNEALFNGYFFSGIARYLYAAYFGLTENAGGGVIDNGPFIPSEEMYDLAIEKLQVSLSYTEDDYLIRVINSLMARIFLFMDDYQSARQYGQNGMQEGDSPYQALYTIGNVNYYYYYAGRFRTQNAVDFRFHDYILADSTESNRILIESIIGTNEQTYYRQAKYLTEESPITLISWQENELMLAELDLREGNDTNALDRVNRVRASQGIGPLDSMTMEDLIDERDKEMFVTGIRLIDQRRFDDEYNTWHLGPNTWRYLPIPESERSANPNF